MDRGSMSWLVEGQRDKRKYYNRALHYKVIPDKKRSKK